MQELRPQLGLPQALMWWWQQSRGPWRLQVVEGGLGWRYPSLGLEETKNGSEEGLTGTVYLFLPETLDENLQSPAAPPSSLTGAGLRSRLRNWGLAPGFWGRRMGPEGGGPGAVPGGPWGAPVGAWVVPWGGGCPVATEAPTAP